MTLWWLRWAAFFQCNLPNFYLKKRSFEWFWFESWCLLNTTPDWKFQIKKSNITQNLFRLLAIVCKWKFTDLSRVSCFIKQLIYLAFHDDAKFPYMCQKCQVSCQKSSYRCKCQKSFLPFKRYPLSVFDHFVKLALKGLNWFEM